MELLEKAGALYLHLRQELARLQRLTNRAIDVRRRPSYFRAKRQLETTPLHAAKVISEDSRRSFQAAVSIPPDFYGRAFLQRTELWGLLPVDLERGAFLDCNDVFARNLQLRRDDILGQSISVMAPDYVPMGSWIMRLVKRFGIVQSFNIPISALGEVHDIVWSLEYEDVDITGDDSVDAASSDVVVCDGRLRRPKCVQLLGFRARPWTSDVPPLTVCSMDGTYSEQLPALEPAASVNPLPMDTVVPAVPAQFCTMIQTCAVTDMDLCCLPTMAYLADGTSTAQAGLMSSTPFNLTPSMSPLLPEVAALLLQPSVGTIVYHEVNNFQPALSIGCSSGAPTMSFALQAPDSSSASQKDM